jgi:outer membrane cobalamin receptor
LLILPLTVRAQPDTAPREIGEVVVTGAMAETALRNVPMSVSVVDRKTIEHRFEPSLLPTLTEEVPGLFITSRGLMGYGVSTGSAGGMSIRGIGGSPTTGVLLLIDGHPQFMGMMGHPLPDAYVAMLAERVEVVEGPASALYGSNAMGGVINIITRKTLEDGVKTGVHAMYGSHNTLNGELNNAVRRGKFSSYVSLGYNRSDGHRENMDFAQYSGYGKMGYDFTQHWNAFADVSVTKFTAANPGLVTTPVVDNEVEVLRGVTSVSVENKYRRTSGAIKLFYNFGAHDINEGYHRDGGSPLATRFHSRDYMWGGNLYQTVSPFAGNEITAKLDYYSFGGYAWNTFISGAPAADIADKTLYEVAGYVGMRQSLGEMWVLNGGVRLDHNEQTGAEWVQGHNTWSAAVRGGWRDRFRGGDRSGQMRYEDTYQSASSGLIFRTDTLTGKDLVHLYEWNIREDVGFVHRFGGEKGHTLAASFYSFYQGNAMEHFHTELWDLRGQPTRGHDAEEYEYRFTAQGNVDYVRPLANGDGKFEAGYQLYSYTEDGDYTIWMYGPENQRIGAAPIIHQDAYRRDDLYKKYLMRRDIHALYAMFSHSYRRLSYQLGLRGEYYHWRLDASYLGGRVDEAAQHTRHKFDLFPSAHLSYDLGRDSRLHFAYARRITQPELFWVEPYVVYVDYYTAQCGNPNVQPEYTNSLELGYHKSFGNHTLAGTLFYRARTDKVERVRVPYRMGVTLDSVANVGHDNALGAEAAANLQILRRWTLDANGSFYHYEIKNAYKMAGEDTESWNWQLAVNNNVDVFRTTRLRLEGYYVGPSVSTQGRVRDFFYFNLSLRQQLFKNRLTATLVVRDLFSTAQYLNTREGQWGSTTMLTTTDIRPTSPLFTLTLAYTFNNFRAKQKEEKVSHDLFEGTNR